MISYGELFLENIRTRRKIKYLQSSSFVVADVVAVLSLGVYQRIE